MCTEQCEALYHAQATPNQFHNLLQFRCQRHNLPSVSKVAIQEVFRNHHHSHRKIYQDYWIEVMVNERVLGLGKVRVN